MEFQFCAESQIAMKYLQQEIDGADLDIADVKESWKSLCGPSENPIMFVKVRFGWGIGLKLTYINPQQT